MTLVAIARKDGFEIFTQPRRIAGASAGLQATPRDEAVLAEIDKAT
jgi:hypothetical protein